MLVTRLQSTVEKFSGMRLGHVGSLLDVATVMRGRYHAGPGSSKRVDATRRHGGGSQRKMKRTRAAPDNARTAARQCRIIIGNLAGQRNDLD
jgi:hypothetical protein